MDRPISNAQKRKNKRSQFLKFGLIIAIIVIAFFFLRSLLTANAEIDKFRIGIVERGDMENTITAFGLIVPSYEQQLNASIDSEIKSIHLETGSKVKEGDLILNLDKEFVQLQYDQLVDQLELRKNKITRLKLEYDKNLRDLSFDDQIKGLQISSMEAQLSDMQRLKDIGGATQEEFEQAELNLKIAVLEKKKLETELAFNQDVVESDKRNLELEVYIQEKKIKELKRKLTETEVRAPEEGVLTWLNENIGQKVNEGDPLARIANLSKFKIEGSCADRYGNQINVGMEVNVRINNKKLTGYISSILPAIENNTIEFVVDLEKPGDAALKPNMRVELFLITERKENVLRIQNGPGFSGAVQQEVFVVEGKEALKKSVKIGSVNYEFVEILPGILQEGDQVIISDMQDYDHLNRIQLN